MNFKRFLTSLFALALILAFSVSPVLAAEFPENQGSESLQNAAAQLRAGIKEWENFITVTFTAGTETFDGTKESAQVLAEQVLDLALAHTGAPDEGDYLQFNIGYREVNSLNYTQQNGDWQFTVTYYIVYWTTAQQEAELDAEIEALVQALELKSDLTDYEKIFNIYQYITGNITYDYENLENDAYGLKFTTYAAAVNKTAVCQGYTTLFYRLALEAGIDNRVITGIGYGPEGSEEHSWNIVRLDGAYYNLDATWDAESYDYFYFLKSSADFLGHEADPHYLTEDFLAAYPLAEDSYERPGTEAAADALYEYQVVEGKAIVTQYTGTEADVVVPATLDGYPVYAVSPQAFFNNSHIVSLTFSEGIEWIDSYAIQECINLKAIHLPSTVDFTANKDPDFQCRVICGAWMCPYVETITVAEDNPNLTVQDGVLYSKDMTFLRYYPTGDTREYFEIPEGVLCIGAAAFEGNQHLKEIKMPDTVRRLNYRCFSGCTNLEKINISNSCNFMDQDVFSETALESLHLPASLEMLYYGSFGYSSKLKNITVDPANPVYYMEDNVLYCRLTEEIIQKHYNAVDPHVPGLYLVRYLPTTDAATFSVPEEVVGIDSLAFESCSTLTRITLPENLRFIFVEAFGSCEGLVELVIPASVEFLDVFVIHNTSLENLVFLGDMPEMSDFTFPYLTQDIYYPAGNATWDAAIQMYAHEEGIRWIEACETHQFQSITRKPTCTKSGYSGRECSVCGLVEVTDILESALGHDFVQSGSSPSTCDTRGATHYSCTRCPAGISDNFTPPLGHSYDENGVCVNCVANETQNVVNSTGSLDGDSVMIMYLMFGGAIGCLLLSIAVMLLGKLISKLRKK